MTGYYVAAAFTAASGVVHLINSRLTRVLRGGAR